MRIRNGFISNSSTSSFVVALPNCKSLQEAEQCIGKKLLLKKMARRGSPGDYRCDLTMSMSRDYIVWQLELLKDVCTTLHPNGEVCELFSQEKRSCNMCDMLNKRLDTLVPRHAYDKDDIAKPTPPVYRSRCYRLNPIVTCFDCFSEFMNHCIVVRDWSNKLARMLKPELCSFPAGSSDPPAKSERKREENERHNMQQPINVLPNPVLLTILSYLRLNEAVGPCMLVCRRWASLNLSARPQGDPIAASVFWKPQALGYLRDMIVWMQDHNDDFKVADVGACVSPGFSGATQWQYVALSAFARWIRSSCADPSRPEMSIYELIHSPLPLTPITLLTQPCRALPFYDKVLGADRGYTDSSVFGGLLLLELDRVGVYTDNTVWQFLEWASKRSEGTLAFGILGGEGASSDVGSMIKAPVFKADYGAIEKERKVCGEERNKRRESAMEQWGLREMWAEQEQRDREEEEERMRKREEGERRWKMVVQAKDENKKRKRQRK